MGVSVQNERGGLVSCAAFIVGGNDPEEPMVDLVITDHQTAMPARLKPDAAAELGYALLFEAKRCGASVKDLDEKRLELDEIRDLKKGFFTRR